MYKPSQIIRIFLLSLVLCCSWNVAQGAYPDKPVKIIIGFPAGGPLDAHIRLLVDKLQSALGQTVIVDYKAGAGGAVGAQFVAQSPADGYTVLLANTGTMVINPAIYTKSPYDTLKDFQPIARTAQQPLALIVNKDVQANTLKEFIAYAKANPGKLNYGSAGNGGISHLVPEMLKSETGIFMVHIPFKGSAQTLQAVMGGHTMGMSDSTGWGQMVDAGKLRLLATYGSKRTTRWSTVPTLNDLGYDTVADSPYGVCGPKNMDPAVVKILHDAFKKTLTDPAVLAVFAQFDQPVIEMNTEEYTKFARDNYQKEKVIIEKLGLAKQA